MSLCPKCNDILSIGARACACGWRQEPKREGGPDLTCPWNDHGQTCGRRGSLSDALNGMGPWYCSEHYWRLKGRFVVHADKPLTPYRERWYRERDREYEEPKPGLQIPVPKREAA